MRLKLTLALVAALVGSPPAGERHLRFSPGLPVARGVAGAPRLLSGAPDVVLARINAAMAHADTRGRSSAADCRSSLREQRDLPGGGSDTPWRRQVDVTFAGPRFFAVLIKDSYYCGGAYPSGEDQALVYDLNTGRPVDWTPLFPATLRAQTVTESASDGATLGFFKVTPALAKLIGPDENCRDGLEDRYIMIWPDRAAGALVLGLRGFPHAVQACEDDTALKPAQLQRLGFSTALIEAISHRDQ